MLRSVLYRRWISARRAKRIAMEAEDDAMQLPQPVPPSADCLSMWKDGLSLGVHGGVHGCYKKPEFVSIMSRIFDLVYVNTGVRLPRATPTMPQFKLYKFNEIEKINDEITEHLEKMKYSVNVKELRKKKISRTIHYEPSIANHSQDNYVFVDISPSKTKETRAVLMRKPNGDLDVADWDVRERMEVVFYGGDEQTYPYPSFTNSSVIRGLSPHELVSVLCYITAYIPADSPLYHNAVGECFETICRKRGFSCIASTHFLIPFLYHCLAFSNSRLYYVATLISRRSNEAIGLFAKAFAFVNTNSNTSIYLKEGKGGETDLIRVFLEETKLIQMNAGSQNRQESSDSESSETFIVDDESLDNMENVEFPSQDQENEK